MLKAFSKQHKERNVVINKTVFSFDKEGYCSVPNIGNASLDFAQLLKKNNITEVLDEPEVVPEVFGEERVEDAREGIDNDLLAEEAPVDVDDEKEDEPEEVTLYEIDIDIFESEELLDSED